ncbi:hypothetical protein PUN28_011222 [Cardiocondyla obscurior]|uniref:Uncharacterized protein n=1 Tax=Cardiocondyla obscurior TaxID=286306 RepID=A0AAW2FQT0_9HYME
MASATHVVHFCAGCSSVRITSYHTFLEKNYSFEIQLLMTHKKNVLLIYMYNSLCCCYLDKNKICKKRVD